MSTLMQELHQKALQLGVPWSVHLDVTYRCNERCVHCYLDHDDHGELSLGEIKDVLQQLADAGVFILTLSGGEVFMRMDFAEILRHARSLGFVLKIKTNAFMIREKEAALLREVGVQSVQVSIYSHRAEVHDAITKLPGSLKRSLAAVRFLKSRGVNVTLANVLMRQNLADAAGVRALGKDLGVPVMIDPTITPKIDGDRGILGLGLPPAALGEVFHDPEMVGDVDAFCATPSSAKDGALDDLPCSAGHTACYISPYGDVYPCVQFPLACGNVRREKFIDIWRDSPRLNEVREIRGRDLPTCSGCSHFASCTRCPGLAFMEGNMRGPSSQDCEKSFARTGIPSANMLARRAAAAASEETRPGATGFPGALPALPGLVQISGLSA